MTNKQEQLLTTLIEGFQIMTQERKAFVMFYFILPGSLGRIENTLLIHEPILVRAKRFAEVDCQICFLLFGGLYNPPGPKCQIIQTIVERSAMNFSVHTLKIILSFFFKTLLLFCMTTLNILALMFHGWFCR